ncbi:MAG: toll/interleukin-1 receptor domain-containing protein [Candidatus Thiodiazotropha sp.]
MIGIYSTVDAIHSAEEIAEALISAWPLLNVISSDGKILPDLPFIGEHEKSAWDDLLLIVFGSENLPDELHEPIKKEIEAARAEHRASRVLPVSTLEDHRRPPLPLENVKAIHCPSLSENNLQRITRRVGALLSLWLRGDNRKIFVSHRQADGREVAAQVTDYLQDHGYNAWRDEERLFGGDIVQDEIERHVSDSNLVLLLDTPKAKESDWIAAEVDAAIACFVPLVPILLRPADVIGRDAGPGIYSTAELVSHRITIDLSANDVVEPLTNSQLDDMLAAVEDYLSRLLRAQRSLAAKVEETFLGAMYNWQAVDAQRYLFACSKDDGFGGLTRMLSHCSVVSPRYYPAVRALQQFHTEAAGTNAFTYRLFLYEPPIPRPELVRLARDHRFDQDPHLRLLDPGRLADFLKLHQSSSSGGTPS